MTGTRLDIIDLCKTFSVNPVLDEINLTVNPGKFVAIVGRSGCGKSTLLRLIAGLETPTRGGILLDGEPVRGLNPQTRIMFQEARLLLWQSVLQNVELKKDRKDRSRWALEQVGLSDKAYEFPLALSGGQKQRVALARALVSQPRLLLLDEPLGALDALTRIEMQELIEKIWQEEGFTTVLITHDVEEAVTLADRVLLLEQGRFTLDLSIDLPRPRRRGSASFALLVEQILDRVLNRPSEARERANLHG
ncbi:ATP-binding cassette domain-containing protein [Pannus brasiliensis CCIBt3594]|uniref:ATP-binding cassette domain-containing protein n=1 Tax=Pannus brasiliensis CCIBt3594 TaxID=1427578 RepID=A0AAW9QY38_9CHRO